MLKQEYSSKNLSKIIRHKHVFSWNMWHNNSEKNRILQKYADEINQNDYLTGEIIVQMFNGKNTYRPELAVDFLKLKLTNYFIKRIYKVSQADRRKIIKQIKIMLSDGSPYKLLKLDISDFYESIPLSTMINRLKDDMLLCGKGLNFLESLQNKIQNLPEKYRIDGLPRGIDVSATLSELFMLAIDREIKKIPEVFFYARYVDDIIIMHSSVQDVLIGQCKEIILRNNLKINESKMEIISFEEDNVSKRTFDFLGYRFSIMPKSDDRMGKKIEVDIAEKKINKLKKRIVHSFISYVKDNDLGLLKCRLRFLTGVVRLQKSTQGTLCAGNAFNYSELTSCKTLHILDGFVRNLLLRNTSRLEKLVFSKLSATQKNDLLKISFAKGYESRLTMNYTRNQAKKIRNAWRAL